MSRAFRTAALAMAFLAGSLTAQAAETKTAYLQSYGGSIQAMLQQYGLAERFNKETGYTVTLVPKVSGAEIIGTAIAQANDPHIDLVFVDEAIWLGGLQRGIFATLDSKDFPNFAKMYDPAFVKKDGQVYGVAPYADIMGLMYQPKLFEKNKWPLPTSWQDLFRPELKGLLALSVMDDYGYFLTIQLAKMNGGGQQNMKPGFDALKKLAPGAVWTESAAKSATLMSQGDAAIAVRAIGIIKKLKAQGVPIELSSVAPMYLSPTVMGIMKNAPNPTAAKVFLNWVIGQYPLSRWAEEYGKTPMNKDVHYTEAEAKDLGIVEGPAAMNALAVIDFADAAQHMPEWDQTFRSEVATLSN